MFRMTQNTVLLPALNQLAVEPGPGNLLLLDFGMACETGLNHALSVLTVTELAAFRSHQPGVELMSRGDLTGRRTFRVHVPDPEDERYGQRAQDH